MKLRMLMRFIILAGITLAGVALMRTTPVQGKNVMTSEAARLPETSLPPSSNPVDEAAVRALYEQQINGWNKGSGTAFAAVFTDDADLVAFDGTHLQGRKEIASFHQQLFNTLLKGSRLQAHVKSVRFLSPDIAVMHAVSETVMPGQTRASPQRDLIQTLIFKKRDAEWRITAVQDSRISPTRKTARIPN